VWRRAWGQCGGGGSGERYRRMKNMVQIVYTHVCKWKMIPVETVPKMGGRRVKESSGGGEFKYDTFVITFINATVYLPPAQQ
jgi:hypothetical protein